MENYDVELFEDGLSALKSIQLRAPDAIVLDLQLPDIDGLEICRRIRRAGDATPILMLTARDAVNDRVDGLDVGADDYLVKPFDLAELLARLRALLRRHNVGRRRRHGPALRGPHAQPPDPRSPPRHASRSNSPRSSSTCSNSSCNTRARSSPATRSSTSSGATTSTPGTNSLAVYIGYLRRKLEEAQRAATDPDGARRGLRASHRVTFRSRASSPRPSAPRPSRSCSRASRRSSPRETPSSTRWTSRSAPRPTQAMRRRAAATTASVRSLVLANGQTVPTSSSVPIDATILDVRQGQEPASSSAPSRSANTVLPRTHRSDCPPDSIVSRARTVTRA